MRSNTLTRGVAVLALAVGGTGAQTPSARQQLVALVEEVQDADYRADLSRLATLYLRMEPFTRDAELRLWARYWRGFALWRRALNGANENGTREQVVADFRGAVDEYRAALALDTTWIEAKIGLASNVGSVGFFAGRDTVLRHNLFREGNRLHAAIRRTDSLNPRGVFVFAGRLFWGSDGSQSAAIELVERRLASLQTDSAADKLAPAWGEAELHMLLAFFKVSAREPDAVGARKHADAALQLRPHWHYVKAILMPQIEKAIGRDEQQVGSQFRERLIYANGAVLSRQRPSRVWSPLSRAVPPTMTLHAR